MSATTTGNTEPHIASATTSTEAPKNALQESTTTSAVSHTNTQQKPVETKRSTTTAKPQQVTTTYPERPAWLDSKIPDADTTDTEMTSDDQEHMPEDYNLPSETETPGTL